MPDTAAQSPDLSLAGLAAHAGAPRSHDGLTVFPLLAEPATPMVVDLLVDAIAAGTLTISEVGTGTVPSLLARNAGAADVLILDGEQLIGARQNRITNRSILLASGTTSEIPVSCMEQGRWHFTSETFSPAEGARQAPSGVRRHARDMEVEVAVARGRGTHDAAAMAQGVVWGTIGALSEGLGGRSPTGAMDEVYERNRPRLESWLAHYPLEAGQIGIAAFLDARPLALDAVGCPGLWARVHARFLGGYVVDALAHRATGRRSEEDSASPGRGSVERFLVDVNTAHRIESDTVGCGRYQVLSGSAVGAELVDDRADAPRLAHLSAFPALRDAVRPDPAGLSRRLPLAAPSRRRRS